MGWLYNEDVLNKIEDHILENFKEFQDLVSYLYVIVVMNSKDSMYLMNEFNRKLFYKIFDKLLKEHNVSPFENGTKYNS